MSCTFPATRWQKTLFISVTYFSQVVIFIPHRFYIPPLIVFLNYLQIIWSESLKYFFSVLIKKRRHSYVFKTKSQKLHDHSSAVRFWLDQDLYYSSVRSQHTVMQMCKDGSDVSAQLPGCFLSGTCCCEQIRDMCVTMMYTSNGKCPAGFCCFKYSNLWLLPSHSVRSEQRKQTAGQNRLASGKWVESTVLIN